MHLHHKKLPVRFPAENKIIKKKKNEQHLSNYFSAVKCAFEKM